jgi:hypothetical protein
MAQNRLCIPQVSLTRWVHFVGVRGRKLSYTLSRTYTSTAKQATAAAHAAAYMRRTCAARGSGGGDAAATVYLHSGWIPDETTHGHIGQLDSQLLQAKKVIDKKIIGQTATGN